MRPALVAGLALLSGGCGTGADVFVGGRIRNLCLEAYPTCGTTAGCRLTPEQYVVGTFPGARRVVVPSERNTTRFEVRLFLEEAIAPGSELQVQARDADCALDLDEGRFEDEDYDLIEAAGNDGLLRLDPLVVEGPGEHLVEIFSDARARYLLIIEPLPDPLADDGDTDSATR
jgi:hypothetical protein